MSYIHIYITLLSTSNLDYKVQNSFGIMENKYFLYFKTIELLNRLCHSVNDFSMSMISQCQCWFLNN